MYITGGIVCKGDNLYPEASNDFNLAFKKHPSIIVFCFSENDVKNALKYSIKNNIPFRIRSGRHDYEATSILNKGMVIDISNINYSFIDEKNKMVKLGGGITSGKMYSDLIKKGYTIPAGTCNDVGFSGLTTCGGVGYAARLFGLSCDNLLEVHLINYKGEKLIVNKFSNPNLFWALKGGLSSNFGIVTALIYKIIPVCMVSTYSVTFDSKYFVDVLRVWQEVTPYTDPRLTTTAYYEKNFQGEVSLSSFGQFFGYKDELKKLIKPLLSSAPIKSLEINYVPYEAALNTISSGCSGPQKFKATGSFIYTPLNTRALKTLEYKLLNAPKHSKQFYEFIGLNGNVANVKPHETAFIHRNSLYLLELKSVWNSAINKEPNQTFINNAKSFLDTVGCGTYRGFTDFNIKNFEQQYYGSNYSELREVKTFYDPYNIFNFPQSIRPY